MAFYEVNDYSSDAESDSSNELLKIDASYFDTYKKETKQDLGLWETRFEKLIKLNPKEDSSVYRHHIVNSSLRYFDCVGQVENHMEKIIGHGYRIKWILSELFVEAQKLACFYKAKHEDDRPVSISDIEEYEYERSHEYVQHVAEIFNMFKSIDKYKVNTW